jgi:hypothetical protein
MSLEYDLFESIYFACSNVDALPPCAYFVPDYCVPAAEDRNSLKSQNTKSTPVEQAG